MAEKTTDVEIELTDEEFMVLAKMAHSRNITFNQLANEVLKEQLKKYETT